MALWVKTPDNQYVNISTLTLAFVVDITPNGAEIHGKFSDGSGIVLKTGFASVAIAQQALDNAITNLGGSL